jgi:hypothetical protein
MTRDFFISVAPDRVVKEQVLVIVTECVPVVARASLLGRQLTHLNLRSVPRI